MHLIPTLVRIITTEVMETTKISSLPAIIIFLYYKEMVFLSHVHWKPAVIMLLGPDLSNRENITASIFNVMLWFGETSFRTFSPSEISCFGASSCQHKLIAVTKLPNWVFSSANWVCCLYSSLHNPRFRGCEHNWFHIPILKDLSSQRAVMQSQTWHLHPHWISPISATHSRNSLSNHLLTFNHFLSEQQNNKEMEEP